MKHTNMKRYLNILSMVVLAGTVGLLSVSCSSEEDNEDKAVSKKSPLKISVATVATTRAFFEGTKLPDECVYHLFLFNSKGVIEYGANKLSVKYVKGESLIATPVYVTDNGKVVAVYGNNEYIEGNAIIPINTEKQQDILVASSSVKPEYPEVSLTFKHIMARVALRITKSAENNRTYEFGQATINGVRSGSYYLYNEKQGNYGERTSLIVKAKDNSVLSSATDVVEYEFLTLPQSSSELNFTLSGSLNTTHNLPGKTLYGGNRYVFNAVIKGSNLEIQSVSVEPWSQETHEMEIDLNK